MKVTKDKVENNQAYLTIEMEPAELEAGLDKAYHRLVRKANIPGFRKGKAPRPLLEQFIGKAALLEDAINFMAPEVTEKAIEQEQLKVISRPEVELEKVEPVTFKAVVPLRPVVKLGDYNSLRIAPESVELKEEDINKTVEHFQHQNAAWEPVDRQVEYNDLIILDIASNVGEQPFINQKDAQYQVVKDSEFPMKGFSEQMIGLKMAENKEFSLGFPADFPRAELAGREVKFRVDVKEIKIEKMPEVNAEFAKLVNPEFKDVEEMRNKIRADLQLQAEEKAHNEYEKKVVEAIVSQSTAEYPPVLVEEQIDRLVRDQMRRYQIDEKGMEEYLQSVKKTPQQLRDELRPVAEKQVKQSLVLSKIGEEEKIQINEEDIQAEIKRMTAQFPEQQKAQLLNAMNNQQGFLSVASMVATRKVLEKLTTLAKSPAPQKAEEPVVEKKEKPEEA